MALNALLAGGAPGRQGGGAAGEDRRRTFNLTRREGLVYTTQGSATDQGVSLYALMRMSHEMAPQIAVLKLLALVRCQQSTDRSGAEDAKKKLAGEILSGHSYEVQAAANAVCKPKTDKEAALREMSLDCDGTYNYSKS